MEFRDPDLELLLGLVLTQGLSVRLGNSQNLHSATRVPVTVQLLDPETCTLSC